MRPPRLPTVGELLVEPEAVARRAAADLKLDAAARWLEGTIAPGTDELEDVELDDMGLRPEDHDHDARDDR